MMDNPKPVPRSASFVVKKGSKRHCRVASSISVAHKQRHSELRRLLRQRLLLLLRIGGIRYCCRGQQQLCPSGHGGSFQRQCVFVRVQGCGIGTGRGCNGAIAGKGICGQIPRSGRADFYDRGRVQPRDPQSDRVRDSSCMKNTNR